MECSPSLLCKRVFALILYLEMFSGPRSENKTDTNGNATHNNEPSKQFFLHVVLEHPKTKKPIHLLGTNHVSKSAEEEVRQAVKELKPDTIVLELSSERLGLLTMPWPPSEFRFQYTQPIRSSLSYFYYKLGTILGVRPGGEFFAAFMEGKKQKARIILGDRNFDVTSSRIYRTITPTEIISSLPFLFTFAWDMARFVRMTRQYDKGLLTRDQIEALVNDELTSQESFEKTMDDNEKMPPSVKKSMITERDQYIASVLRECTGDKIVGVFGGAHIEGIKRHLYDVVKDENEFRRKLEAVPDHTIYSAYIYPAAVPFLTLTGALLGYRGVRSVFRLSIRGLRKVFSNKGNGPRSDSTGGNNTNSTSPGQSTRFDKYAQIRRHLDDTKPPKDQNRPL
jgi:pheromone shutdown protein TraB